MQGCLAEVQPEGYANATGKEEVVADLKNWSKGKKKSAKLVDNGSEDSNQRIVREE